MDAPHTRTTSAWHLWLFNPFHFLAGGQAIAVFIATGAGGRLLPGTAASAPVQSEQRHLAAQLATPKESEMQHLRTESEQHHLAAQLATQILQAHEQGRFEALGPEDATEKFRRAFTAEVQRHSHQNIRQLFGTFEGLGLRRDPLHRKPAAPADPPLQGPIRDRVPSARSARRPRPGR